MAPDDPKSQYNLANSLQHSRSTGWRFHTMQAALAVDDGSADAHNNLGVTLMALRKYPEAKRHFSRALALEEEQSASLCELGKPVRENGDYNQAIAYSRRALALDPKSLNAHQCIAIALRAWAESMKPIARLRELAAGASDDEEVREGWRGRWQ